MICLTEQNDEIANPKSELRFVLSYIGKITKLLLYIQISIRKLTAPENGLMAFVQIRQMLQCILPKKVNNSEPRSKNSGSKVAVPRIKNTQYAFTPFCYKHI